MVLMETFSTAKIVSFRIVLGKKENLVWNNNKINVTVEFHSRLGTWSVSHFLHLLQQGKISESRGADS